MKTVFVDGQEGTTGLQIRERLETHGGVRVLEIEADRRKDTERRRELINEADVVFLCLPDAAARESVALVDAANTRTRVIDSSTAHRVAQGWTYGLPELRPGQREAIRESRRVAVTGCHAAGFILAVAPLVALSTAARSGRRWNSAPRARHRARCARRPVRVRREQHAATLGAASTTKPRWAAWQQPTSAPRRAYTLGL
jgi:N-acetyl-gamma-glutamyl-phosphate reductase